MRLEVGALGGCARDPRVPWYTKLLALLVVAYALSPIDLIPDVIPVLGHIDDLILVPLGIVLVIRLIPPEVLAEHRRAASRPPAGRGASGVAAAVIMLWAGAFGLVLFWLLGLGRAG